MLSEYLNVPCIYILCICVQCFTFYIKSINKSMDILVTDILITRHFGKTTENNQSQSAI